MFGGIDLGGSKIETRLYDASLKEVARQRVATPTASYDALLSALRAAVQWLQNRAEISAIGLGTPGVIDPGSGAIHAANIPLRGEMLGRDLQHNTVTPIYLLKDCSAFAFSEAILGAGQGLRSVVGLIIGTGVAGGHVIDGALLPDLNGQQGEYGHLPLPAELVARHALTLHPCACGLQGCFETYLSGPGIVRLAEEVTGARLDAPSIVRELPLVRAIWADIAGALVATLARAVDPEMIILGGGLGTAEGVPEDIRGALKGRLLSGATPPQIASAAFGDASGALGAALFSQRLLGVANR